MGDAVSWDDVLRLWREAPPASLLPRARLLVDALSGFEFADVDGAAARAPANVAGYGGAYACALLGAGALASFRSPAAVLAHAVLAGAVALTNDTLAAATSRAVVRAARAVHPPTARRLHAASGGAAGLAGPPHGRARLRVAGAPRGAVQAGLTGAALTLLLFVAGAAAARRAASAFAFVGVLIAVHAAFKRPDPKTAATLPPSTGAAAAARPPPPAAWAAAPQAQQQQPVWRPSGSGAVVSPRGSGVPVAAAAAPAPVLHPSLVPPPAAAPAAARRDYTL